MKLERYLKIVSPTSVINISTPKPQRLEIKKNNISFIMSVEGDDGDQRVSLI